MSKVIVEFSDNDDGKVNVKLNFYPELKAKEIPTGAQQLALDAVAYLSKREKENE